MTFEAYLKFSELVQCFKRNNSGNIAITFALASLPILGAVGAAIDYTRYHQIHSDMQNAADSAALAAVIDKEDLTEAQIRRLVRKYFIANGGEAKVERKTRVRGRETAEDVVVDAWVRVDTLFMHLLNGKKANKITVKAVARKTEIKSKGAEIALVVDTTASMNYGSTWAETVNVVEKALQKIEDDTEAGSLYTTLIPFTDRVNIGTSRTDWLSATDSLTDWLGCVELLESNQPGYPYHVELGTPNNTFLPTVPKYWTGVYLTRGNVDCPPAIEGPTKRLSDIRTAMDGLSPNSYSTGRFDEAIAWGWRAVAKEWRGEWGVSGSYPSDDPDVQKVIAFFTDGKTNINHFEFDATKTDEYGWNRGSEIVFWHFENMCERIKAEGIEVYIFHVVGNSHSVDPFKRCAGDNYVKVDSSTDIEEGLISISETGTSTTARLVK